MNVTTPEKRWTPDRLDDLKEAVDDGFAAADKKMDDGFARVDKKMDDGFARVDVDIRSVRGELKSEAEATRGEVSALKKSLFTASVSVTVALIGCCATLAAVAIAVN